MPPTQLLLVEDDPQIVRALLPALEVCGHAVTVANDGASAMSHIDQRPWDALVVDLGLPDMDGRLVIKHLRSTSPTPVIVISARHSVTDRLECSDVGANEFLAKPFAAPELIGHLASLTGGRAAHPD